ncbi:hypothetical protein DPMN_175222 [Dreissena polymorpha]|uniref:Uncharacterized protein n=1 Tax=Dreissena polymorpha TaxID=45954 RepID=A0A9D4E625_DREPO|nr:hypothetical protein DPMN_175222 [Dreissena polymorpha]
MRISSFQELSGPDQLLTEEYMEAFVDMVKGTFSDHFTHDLGTRLESWDKFHVPTSTVHISKANDSSASFTKF